LELVSQRMHASYYSNLNLSMCGIFLIRLLPRTDNRELLPNPKETYDLNLCAVTVSICLFRTRTAILGAINCTILGSLPSPQEDGS